MTRRRGFTLVEMLVAVVLLGIVGLSISRLLQSQMRFFQRSSGAREARAVSRNALNLMRNEMRMIEPSGITAASPTSITVRVPYAMGVYCSSSTATFVAVDSLTRATAAYSGYAYRDTALNAPYVYVTSSSAPTTGIVANCTSAGMTPIPGGTVRSMSPTMPLLPAGAPVFIYQTITYSFANSVLVPGRTALWRTVAGGAAEEVAVPFDATSVFRFYDSGETTAEDAPPATLGTISGVELVLIGESERNSPGTNAPESSDTRVSIFFRNAVN
ncbi:MAG TPA: type II secretion system protein [Gemmatimonadaceae bacterium]|nr:type II secretion system protein [Gemmatimonadaceae bacterium]